MRRVIFGLAAALLLTLFPAAAQAAAEAPTGLQADNVEAGVRLTWEAPEADAGSVTGYRILTRQPEYGEAFYALVDDTPSTSTSYVDPGAVHVMTYGTLLEGRYYVRVKATESGENTYKLAYGTRGPDADEVAALEKQRGREKGPASRYLDSRGMSSRSWRTPTAARIGLCWARFRQRIPRTRG